MEIRLEEYEYYIRPGYTDMRKQLLKAIVWDGNGWIEIIKRIECNERFFWPRDEEEARKATLQQVMGLLAGYNVWRPLPELSPEAVG